MFFINLFFISLIFFLVGLVGLICLQRNLLIILLCLELIIISCAVNFIFISKFFNDPKGQVFALLLFAVSAGETAIGLGLLIKIYLLNYIQNNSNNVYYFNKFRY
jgi:NADH-quinone oxidoreductase subunit K